MVNVDKERFFETINMTLSEFMTNKLDGYVVFNYNSVLKINNDINSNKIDNKPIFHVSIAGEPEQGVKEPMEDGEIGRKIRLEYAIYTVINEDYNKDRDRQLVIDRVNDSLYNVFDSESENLPFKQINFNPKTTDLMGENADGLYAVENTLSFRVNKLV